MKHQSLMSVTTGIVCLLLVVVTSAAAFDFSQVKDRISETTLDNGLKVIVYENHDAPVATFITWVDAGSVDDPKGYTGLAHMFEHMAFKGTTTLGTKDIDEELTLIAVEDSLFMQLRAERNKGRLADSAKIEKLQKEYEEAREASYELVKPNEFGEIVSREGGVGLNAGTGSDMTVYFFSLPSNKVELWMALESERFLNPVFREMYKERDVVAEERRMRTESNPFGRMIEEFLALSFKAHPYGVPGIGHMSDIQYYSRAEARDFYETYYVPSNMVVCIAGDVDPDNVFELARKYFGRIEKKPKPPRIATVEPEQLGERRMIISDPAQPIYAAGWHIPEGTHADRPAIDAMMDYLGQGRTSILYKNLVKDKKMAIQVGAFAGFPGNKYPTMALIYAVPSQGHDNNEVEQEIFTGVEQMKNELISAEDLEEIKARARASFIQGLQGNQGIGFQLAAYHTMWGDWSEMFKELDRINAVTAEDIQRVAKEYFSKQNRVVVMLNTQES